MRRSKARVVWPSLFRNMRLEKNLNKETLSQILDINKTQPKFYKHNKLGEKKEDERYKVLAYYQSL